MIVDDRKHNQNDLAASVQRELQHHCRRRQLLWHLHHRHLVKSKMSGLWMAKFCNLAPMLGAPMPTSTSMRWTAGSPWLGSWRMAHWAISTPSTLPSTLLDGMSKNMQSREPTWWPRRLDLSTMIVSWQSWIQAATTPTMVTDGCWSAWRRQDGGGCW